MYSKISKKEIINMLIEANNCLQRLPLRISHIEQGFEFMKPPYTITVSDICSCNPANGGSGICGCSIANELIKG